ncbi:hypothetical protein QYE76_055147 [Lolium multiflorum]|uniref:Retrotransposon Copia-like N-terminal domain-containing protein n=1 Tax=Lolium multiflorum TaxID=4521 RepID=A0AAD8SZ50_LOLMU|nr:hypothetical protein QYE76_055147 [Lolium multiflorum]
MIFASSSSSFMAPSGGSLGESVSEKLTSENFMIWKAQVMPAIRGAQLQGFLDGSVEEPEKEVFTKDSDGKEMKAPNLEYTRWIAQDQVVLGYLIRNMTREVLVQVAGLSSAQEVWTAVTEMFSSISKARIVHLRTQLNQTRKENRTAQTYFGRIKALADEMANAGKNLDDEDIISYILAGLDDRYDGFVAAITALIKAEKHVSLGDLYSQFVYMILGSKVGIPTMNLVASVQIPPPMQLNVVVAMATIAAVTEEAVEVALTSKVAVAEATMVADVVVIHNKTMAAGITPKAGAGITSSDAKEGVAVVVVEAQMLYVKYVAVMDIQLIDVGNASTKTFKGQNGLQEWW